jgi:aspartyl-tRNA(Asn)/glutamyl-tRNA(Gln) amidotransferase subunit B
VARLLKAANIPVQDCPLSPAAAANLLDLLDKGRITGRQAKEVMEEAFTSGKMPEEIVKEKGFAPPISDTAALDGIIAGVIASNARAVTDYRAGKVNAVQALIGQVMKQTRGQARADIVRTMLLAKLDEGTNA